MECVDCHTAESACPHTTEGPRALNASAVAAGSASEAYRDSWMATRTMVKLGDHRAPTCSDCHGDVHYLPLVQQWTTNDRAEACDAIQGDYHVPGRCPWPHGFFRILSTPHLAGLFLMILTTATWHRIIHVELEMLRWFVRRLGRRRGARTTGHGHTS
jgi:hypothetical protein